MTDDDMDTIRIATRAILIAIGENPDRPGLADTPNRVANAWREFATYDAGDASTTFASASIDQMVVVSGMRVWSMCEHHLMPFWCDVSIGYIADDRVLGLSKFGRIAERAAHRLTMQERLVSDIAVDVMAITKTDNVAVIARGEHLCMSARGIKKPAIMTSSVMRGVFQHEPAARAEFMSLAG